MSLCKEHEQQNALFLTYGRLHFFFCTPFSFSNCYVFKVLMNGRRPPPFLKTNFELVRAKWYPFLFKLYNGGLRSLSELEWDDSLG